LGEQNEAKVKFPKRLPPFCPNNLTNRARHNFQVARMQAKRAKAGIGDSVPTNDFHIRKTAGIWNGTSHWLRSARRWNRWNCLGCCSPPDCGYWTAFNVIHQSCPQISSDRRAASKASYLP